MVSRRDFLKQGAAAAAAAPLVAGRTADAHESYIRKRGGESYSHLSGTKREAIPTACALCSSRCAAMAFVEQGYVVKIEGHPKSIRTRGLLCAKGQAGLHQIYDPDRILYPLKRSGKRGEGKWQRITWDAALDELTGRLKKLRDEGHPEKFMFHHGWISASAEALINDVFLPTYGTGTIANNVCLGQSARQTAQELTWGGHEDNWDFDNTRFVLNFGSNVMEAHTNHVALAQRLARALVDHRVKLVTFDVRLSNTAAKSETWYQIKPGTDLAVVLAMCNVVMNEGLYRGKGEEFLEFCKVTANHDASIADKIAALKAHLKPYTPKWAEKISGISAHDIKEVAVEFAAANPACVISSRGASAHYNGVETERAIQMLAALTGNIDNPGGRCRAVGAQWNYPRGPKKKPEPRSLDILNGPPGTAALPIRGVGHQVLNRIKDGSAGRPEIYMWYNYNPVFANPDAQRSIDILKDESLIPFTVSVTPFYDESAALADLILPDAVYLERYDFEDGVSPDQVPEYYICQPVVPPQGEARDFKDVCCDLAKRMGFPLGFKSGEKFVAAACKLTPIVRKKARGFRRMKKNGVFHDRRAKPAFFGYKIEIEATELARDGVIFDEKTGVYWNWKTAGLKSEEEARNTGYTGTPGAYKGYVGQKIGGSIYAGFAPQSLNTSGYFELFSAILEQKGHRPLPSYSAIPEHKDLKPDQLILTTYRVNVQTLSTTQNCKWLNEIYNDNPAWINTHTAAGLGIGDGDRIKIGSRSGEMEATAKVTQTVSPGTIAISSHGGRWEYGRYASGKRAPFAVDDAPYEALKWWPTTGTHINWIIPNSAEPISGQQRWMDTVVKVAKT